MKKEDKRRKRRRNDSSISKPKERTRRRFFFLKFGLRFRTGLAGIFFLFFSFSLSRHDPYIHWYNVMSYV